MATVVTLDASPTTVPRSMRGEIVDARIAYPDVLHVEGRDGHGELWRLATLLRATPEMIRPTGS